MYKKIYRIDSAGVPTKFIGFYIIINEFCASDSICIVQMFEVQVTNILLGKYILNDKTKLL